jgi:NAD(P)-dependent dehydrogenase (short-subunit alcohol dehydrogenase family)
MKDFKGKVAVITGAASGIGYGLAERAAKEGMKVVLADIEEDALVKAEKDIRALGVDTLAIKTDVSKAEDVGALADKTIDTLGGVHLLCNNAGVGPWNDLRQTTLVDWEWVLSVNLWGVIHGIHFFLPIMLKQPEESHIVNTASTEALATSLFHSLYCVSKHGIMALSETLYFELELVSSNVGVSVLCPGMVKTRIQEPERNRPQQLQNSQLEREKQSSNQLLSNVIKLIDKYNSEGMSPQQVAGIVFDAVKEKRFYILTHPDLSKERVRLRMENILNERNPTSISLEGMDNMLEKSKQDSHE